MPVAGKLYEKEIRLPNYPDSDPAVITIVSNPKGRLFSDIPEDVTGAETNDYLLAKIISKWNFVAQDGTPLPITIETIKSELGDLDKVYLLQAIGLAELVSLTKKNK